MKSSEDERDVYGLIEALGKKREPLTQKGALESL